MEKAFGSLFERDHILSKLGLLFYFFFPDSDNTNLETHINYKRKKDIEVFISLAEQIEFFFKSVRFSL